MSLLSSQLDEHATVIEDFIDTINAGYNPKRSVINEVRDSLEALKDVFNGYTNRASELLEDASGNSSGWLSSLSSSFKSFIGLDHDEDYVMYEGQKYDLDAFLEDYEQAVLEQYECWQDSGRPD